MFNKATTYAALAVAASGMVSAQTFTSCNPLTKTCPADPAFGDPDTCDFTKGACSAFTLADGTTLSYDSKGAHFSIETETNAPTITTGKYIFFGRIDVTVQAAPGDGIVTSAVLQSDDLDEIDWEWVGGDNTQAQSNYFSKGNTSTYDRGAYHPVDSPLSSYHTYSVQWTSSEVQWIIDDNVVRTLTADSTDGQFPQTPMQVKLGTWCAGGKDSAEGTREWAGGYTDFTQAPFVAYYQKLVITDYAGQDSAGDYSSVTEYVYGDHSGTWESIEVKKGDKSDTTSSATASATATSTKKTSTKTTSTKASKTEASETETKTASSSKETKTAATTLTTAAATTGSGSGSSKTSGSDSSAAATTVAGTSASASPTTVADSGASRMVGGITIGAAVALLAQLL